MSPRPQPGKALATQPCAGCSHGHVSLPKPVRRGVALGLLSHGGFIPADPSQGTSLCVGFSPKDPPGRQCFCLFPSSAPPAVLLPILSIRKCSCVLQHPSGAGTREDHLMVLAWGPRHSPTSCTQPVHGQDGVWAGKAAGQAGLPGTGTGWEPAGQLPVGPVLPWPAHVSPCTLAGGDWLAPPKWTQREGLCRRARPGLWGGLTLDTDTACDLRESPRDSESFILSRFLDTAGQPGNTQLLPSCPVPSLRPAR